VTTVATPVNPSDFMAAATTPWCCLQSRLWQIGLPARRVACPFAGVFLRAPVVLDLAVCSLASRASRNFYKPCRAQHQGDGYRRRRAVLARLRDAAIASERASGQWHSWRSSSRRHEGVCSRSFFRPCFQSSSGCGCRSRRGCFFSYRRCPRGATSSAPELLLLDSPVRSGQCIVHPEGDVIVIGSVASGAEVIAGVRSIFMNAAREGRRRFARFPRPNFLPQA